MSNSKHTPGPWRWTANYEPAELEIDIGTYESPGYWGNPTLMAGDVCVVGCDEYWILGGDKYDPDGRANARLIAAAPDLLAALKVAEKAMQADISGIDIGASFEQIRAAIAKATGEQYETRHL